MKIISQYRGLNKGFYAISLAVLVNCAGSFVAIFLSLYLTITLNLDVKYTGLLISIYTLIHIPGSLIGGKLADSFNKKKVMIASQILMSICFIITGFIFTKIIAVAFIMAANFFDGITDPARSALEVDMTTSRDRQAAFSLLYQAFNVGYAIGPIIAAALFSSFPAWLFWGNGVAQIIAVALVLILVPYEEGKETVTHATNKEAPVSGSIWRALLSRPQLILFSIGSFLIAIAYKQISFILPIQFNDLFLAEGTKLYGIVASINSLVVIFLNPMILILSKKYSPIKNMTVAALLYAISFYLFGFANIKWQFCLIAVSYTIGEIVLNNNSKAYQNNNTPQNFRGRFNAVIPLFKTAGTTMGSLFGGILLSKLSYALVWSAMGTLCLITSLIYLFINKRFEGVENKEA